MTPEEHQREAERLLAAEAPKEVAERNGSVTSLVAHRHPESPALLARATVHAILSLRGQEK